MDEQTNLTIVTGSAALRSETLAELIKALAAAQLKFTPALKDKKNPYYSSKYADLNGIIAATQPALAANGLVVIQKTLRNGREAGIRTELMHTSGEWTASELLVPAESLGKDSKVRFDAQSIGIALTYARRYEYQAIVGIAAEDDDDGNAISAPPLSQVPRPPQAPKPTQTAAPVQNTDKRGPGRPPKASKPPSNGNTDDSGGSSAPSSPVVPAVIPNAPAGLPTPEQLSAYKERAKALTARLAEAGLAAPEANGKKLPHSHKVLQYFLKAGDVGSLSELSVSKWDTLLGLMEPRDPKELVGIIEQTISQ